MASLSLPWRPLSQALAVPKSSYRLKTRSFPLRSSRLVSTPRSPKELFFLNFRRMPLLGSRVPNLEENSDFGLEVIQMLDGEEETRSLVSKSQERLLKFVQFNKDMKTENHVFRLCLLSCGITSWLSFAQVAQSSEGARMNVVYEIGELFELGIQLFYLLILLGLLGVGTFFVIRQVLVRRELDLSAKELQEQVRSGDATATEYFELGAVMLRRKFYPAAVKYLQQAIEKWDRDDQDLAQVYNALGVSYVRDNKLDKGIAQFEKAVKLQPGYVTAWNNLGDAYEKKKDLRSALKAFEEVLLFDPNNKVARPRRDALRDRVKLYKGVPLKSEDR